MDNTDVVECIDRSEVRSGSLGEKRPLENGVDGDLRNKKAKRGGDDVGLAVNVKKVAEIVLVLATMGKMRGGRKPTPVEVLMMAQARGKLAEVCKEFAPKDIFPRDAFGTVIDDLGLNRLREQKLGIRAPKMSIAEKLQLTKQKMEKSEVFPLHSTIYTPPRMQSNLSGAQHAVRMFPSDKANHVPVSSGSFQNPSNVVHSSPANSRTLPYQLPTSEVRPGASNVLPSSHLGRAERPHFRIDGGSNGSSHTPQSQATSTGDNTTGKTPTWSMQPQSASFAKAGSDKTPTHSSIKTEGSIPSKPFITQVTPNPTNINHVQHRMNFIQPPSADTHNEVCKIVQKLLHPHLPDHPTWTPPSRDYMNKALTCQICKTTINEVDTALVCDACERGYHLRCLHCNPKAIPRGEWQEWHCSKCLTISNGKPLPPKYGRVMRNISTPKLSSNSVPVQPSLDKNGSQSASNGTVGNDNKLTEMQVNEVHECGIDKFAEENNVSNERSHEEKLTIVSESQPPANLLSNLLENNRDNNDTKMPSITNTLAKQPQNDNGAIKVDDEGDPVKTSGIEGSSLSSMHEVEWVGGALKEIDGKTYYQSCCINGTVYKVKDYALFSSPGNKYLPNKLQAMWDDGKTSKKWVTVARCFFPDDLPRGVGRPCSPESNEVYESNHESTLAAGLIHGPCEVLPPSKFSEESAVQTRFGARGSDRPKPLFLCKWFYDENKGVFRDVTC